jgi:hypothetical protein
MEEPLDSLFVCIMEILYVLLGVLNYFCLYLDIISSNKLYEKTILEILP